MSNNSYKVKTSIGEFWYKRDDLNVLHREDGPAVIKISGNNRTTIYYLNGRRHRADGPAYCEFNKEFDDPDNDDDGYHEYWYHGVLYFANSVQDFKLQTSLKAFK